MTPLDPAKFTRPRLVEIAESVGVGVGPKSTKAGLAQAIQERVGGAARRVAAAEDPSTAEIQAEARVVAIGASLGFVVDETPVADELESRGATGTSESQARDAVNDPDDNPTDEEIAAAEVVAETDEPIAASQELAVLEARQELVVQAPALLPTVAEFHAMREMAAAIAGTQMVPMAYRGKPDDVLAAILTGREMGLGPMQSLREIYVVDGKPSLAANLLLARLRVGGIVILESESTAERAWIRAQRRDTGEIAEVEWTYEAAKKITYKVKGGGTKLLVEKDNWTNYPEDMLWARVVGRLARRLGPDLIGSALPYTSEEVQDWDSGEAATSGPSTGGAPAWSPPENWGQLGQRLGARLGVEESRAWLEELAVVGYERPTIAEVIRDESVPSERKVDLWKRLQVVLRAVEQTEGEIELREDYRTYVSEIFAAAFDSAIALVGPAWALGPQEAATLPQKADVLGGGEAPTPAPEAASAAETTPETPAPDETPVNQETGEEIKF